MTIETVVIIGAGPCGLAAGMQLRRSGINPIVLEKATVGGLLNNANLVENYPGFVDGITGPELVSRMHEQAGKLSVTITPTQVVSVDSSADVFDIHTQHNCYHAPHVIVASGTRPLRPKDVDIPEQCNDRIFYNVYPLRNIAGQTIAVVGGGDAAFDYALNLARNNEVVILNRSSRVTALPLLSERATASQRIAYHSNIKVTTIAPSSATRLLLQLADNTQHDSSFSDGRGRPSPTDAQRDIVSANNRGNSPSSNDLAGVPQPSGKPPLNTLTVDYLLFAIGREPELGFLSPELSRCVAAGEQVDRLHLCGDVRSGMFRQAAIAVGDGIRIAMAIAQEVSQRRSVPVNRP